MRQKLFLAFTGFPKKKLYHMYTMCKEKNNNNNSNSNNLYPDAKKTFIYNIKKLQKFCIAKSVHLYS